MPRLHYRNQESRVTANSGLDYFGQMGFQILLREHTLVLKGNRSKLFAGGTDPAVKEIRPDDGPEIEQALSASPASDLNPARSPALDSPGNFQRILICSSPHTNAAGSLMKIIAGRSKILAWRATNWCFPTRWSCGGLGPNQDAYRVNLLSE